MKYYGNEPQHVGPYYCSNCGWGLPGIAGRHKYTHPIGAGDEKCPNCQASPDEALVFPTKSHVGADGRRTGEFHRGPGEIYKREQEQEP